MYLKLKKDIPKKQKNIFINCPYNFSNKDAKKVLACKNCVPAPCITACKKGAIYYSSKNVVSIDQSKCDGCGDCLKACPYNAIILKDNKAYKCDLCSNQSFSMFCLSNNKEFVELVETISKSKKLEIRNEYLGYNILDNFKTQKTINKKIIETKENKKLYIIKEQILTIDEIEIVNKILNNYKNKESSIDNLEAGKVRTDLQNELIKYCSLNKIVLDQDQFDYILNIAFNNLYNFGPLTVLLKDYDLEEITIIGINKPVYVYHRVFGWLETNLQYTSEQILKDIINKLSWYSNRYITLKNPLLNTYLKDNSRLNAIINPVTESVSVTIRKFSEKPFTIRDLINFKTISLDALTFLSLAFLTDSNIMVVGNTGSGKTTTLNTLLSFIPLDERFVVVEEVREINIPHKHKVFTVVNPELNINIDTLVINTLRMRPDRVVVGEVRTKEESKAIIESMLCGQAKGTYTTFHSQSANEVLLRLGSYGILEADLGVIDLIITQRRYNKYINGKSIDLRNITEISEVIFENNKLELNQLYKYDISSEKLKKVNNIKKLFSKFQLSFGIKSIKDYNKLFNKKKKEIKEELENLL